MDARKTIQYVLKRDGAYSGPIDGKISKQLVAFAQRVLSTSSTDIDWTRVATIADASLRDPKFLASFEKVLAVRERAAASIEAWSPEYVPALTKIQSANGFESYRQTEAALSFLMRGAAIIPVQSIPSASTFILFNPIVDVGLVIELRHEGEKESVAGLLVPGEILRREDVKAAKPSWMEGGDILSKLQLSARKVRDVNALRFASLTSSENPLTEIFAAVKKPESLPKYTRDRIFLEGAFAENEDLPCGAKIDASSGNMENLRKKVAPLKVNLVTAADMDTSTYPIGGAVDSKRAIKFFTLRSDPYVEISVWFDYSSDSCDITKVGAINVFGENTD